MTQTEINPALCADIAERLGLPANAARDKTVARWLADEKIFTPSVPGRAVGKAQEPEGNSVRPHGTDEVKR